ncbi:MAG: Na+/H+ antiporter subunit E [Eubacteriales bacterium]|nr:Na+/H+ antiporter subunit E [Eubacteriales bacterium]
MQKHKRYLQAVLITFIPCYLFWLLLTMSLDAKELLMGLVVCLLAAAFSANFFSQNGARAFRFLSPLRIVRMLVFFCGVFMWELWKTNCSMVKYVLLGKPFHQAIVKVEVKGIEGDYGLAMLADCITLTPGTITMDVAQEDGRTYFYVHWMDMESGDPEQAGELIKGRLEKWIGRICA